MSLKVTFLFLMMWMLTQSLPGQVQSRAFRMMLNNLLSHSVPETSVTDVLNHAKETIFLDARARREYEVSHLPHAIWVGYDDFDLARVADVPKNAHIVVYCSVGYRSEKVAEKLLAAGFSDVSNLVGGIFEWVNRENAVYDTTGGITSRVHAYDRVWSIWLKRGKKVY